jgi:sarcosine dehydrogenase
MNKNILPTHVDAIVIGGGIIGCSTAYHLARDHKLAVVVLEQNRLTSGSTWHAAGLVGQLRNSASITQLLKYSVDLYKRLERDTGLQTGWKMTGCLRLARTQDRMTEFKRLATTARSFGMDMQLLSPPEAQKLWPLMRVDDLVGASFLPTDGQVSPSDITQALVKAARMEGVKFFEGVRVEGMQIVNGRVVSLRTNVGEIYAEKFVNCAGIWAKQIGAMAGVNIPLIPVRHQYVITDKIAGLASNAPTIRDPDRRTYFKEEVGGLVFGGYEPNPQAWGVERVPDDFEFRLFGDDWDHFEPHLKEAMERVPALEKTGIKKMINGPESFTPDGNFILGRPPELHNFYVGCGFNAFGIAAGGGAGWALASWAAKEEAPTDLWAVDIRRFSHVHRDGAFVKERTLEAYAKHYTIAYPHEEYESARPRLVSPLYDELKRRGGVMGSKLGWERVNWFAQPGEEARDIPSMGRQNWFGAVGGEHKSVREAAGLFDQSSFAKFRITGSGAERFLQRICANQIDRPKGSVIYTQLPNSRGGIECDLTITKVMRNSYYVVTGTGFRTHDHAWITGQLSGRGSVHVEDVTEQMGTLSLMGPNARAILSEACKSALSDEKFKFGTAQYLSIAAQRVLALRVSYVGELGWELHMPVSALKPVFDTLILHGTGFGMRLCGYRAIESLRLEKGYRAWGSDITPNDTPFEAGLGWAVKLSADQEFVGRKALEARREKPLLKLFTGFVTERDDVVLVGRETILRDGKYAGYLTSGGFGYTVGKAIGYGYVRDATGVDADYVLKGSYELVVASETVKVKPFLGAIYDPKNLRMKG